MSNPLDALLFFGFLTFLHLWGGAAIGAGVRGRRALPILWGLLVGGTPLYFGIERVAKLNSWVGLGWQVVCLVLAALLVGLAAPRLRAVFLRPGMRSLMIGTFIMAGGAVIGALFFQLGSEALSLIIGSLIFLFGAMWFGSGVQQLRGTDDGR
jgi:hypothetical protein